MKKKHHNQFVRCPENIEDLSGQEEYDYAMLLGGGLIRSSKQITYDPKTKKYTVFNDIDGTTDKYTKEQLLKSNIGEAMKKRSLIAIID